MKTFRVTLTYDRRTHACPVYVVDVQADLPMQARSIARRHALQFWSTDCPLKVTVVELMTPERLARDEDELMQVMGVAA